MREAELLFPHCLTSQAERMELKSRRAAVNIVLKAGGLAVPKRPIVQGLAGEGLPKTGCRDGFNNRR